MNVILYSTHCPKCDILTDKLLSKHIEYTEVNDEREMRKKGFSAVPMLEVDGVIMNFSEANKWVEGLKTEKG